MKTGFRILTLAILFSAATASAQGRVESVSGSQVKLSVGSRDGVTVDQTGTIRQIRGVRDKIITVDVATFRVTDVQEQSCSAELTKLEEGARVGVGNRIAFDPPPPLADVVPAAEPRPETEDGSIQQPSPQLPPEPRPSRPRRTATAPAEPEGKPEPAAKREPEAMAGGTSPAAGQKAVQVGGGVKPPKRLKTVPPVYPDVAREARVQGIVILECTISPRGKVTRVQVLRGIPLLDQAAIDAVKQWEWEPTIIDGEAVPVIMTVTINFNLS
jgi:TonB family protein